MTTIFDFKPIPTITPRQNTWENGTWKFALPTITPISGETPTYQDIVLSGNGSLTLTNAKKNSLSYLKLFGGCSQASTPSPSSPVDIVCNNGALKMVDDELPSGYKRVKDITMDNNCYYTITDFKLRGSDTIRFAFSVTVSDTNVLGCYTSASAQDNYSLYVGSANSTAYLRYNGGAYNSTASPSNLRYDVVISPTGSTGMLFPSTWEEKEFETPVDLCIGTTSVNATSSKLMGTLYGNIVVDGRLKLIPCERVSDGYLGYYDTYTQTFYEKVWGTEPTTSGYDSSHYVLTVDGTTETVEVHGKNLFDGRTESGYITDSGNNNTSPNAVRTVNFIPVKPNTDYTFSSSGEATTYLRIHCYNINQEWISMLAKVTNKNTKTITTPNNAYYLKASFSNTFTNVQIEEGSTATTYEPYFNGGTATATDLLAVEDYKDIQEVLTGNVTRNVGIKVLDGTEEGWAKTNNSFTNVTIFADKKIEKSTLFCTHFQYDTGSTANIPDMCIGCASTSPNTYFRYDTLDTVDEWKAYLAEQYANGTPVAVVYPLATATTEHATGQTMHTQAGTNIVEITQASIDNLPLEAKYKGVV